jgi:hypothetical protein
VDAVCKKYRVRPLLLEVEIKKDARVENAFDRKERTWESERENQTRLELRDHSTNVTSPVPDF